MNIFATWCVFNFKKLDKVKGSRQQLQCILGNFQYDSDYNAHFSFDCTL